MAIDPLKILRIIETGQRVMLQLASFAEDFTALLSPADARALQAALAEIKAENDAGHERLQAKLAAIIAEGEGAAEKPGA